MKEYEMVKEMNKANEIRLETLTGCGDPRNLYAREISLLLNDILYELRMIRLEGGEIHEPGKDVRG